MADSLEVKWPVDSITTSTPEIGPRQCLRVPLGQDGDRTGVEYQSELPSTVTPVPRRPWVESYFSRWARVSGEVRSLTATTSTSAPSRRAARR